MTVYDYSQLEGLWISAGGPRALAPIAAAIAEAESGGNADALNPNDNGGTQSSFGLWQISNGTHVPPSPSWANPAVNAQLAVGKWKGAGGSFTPWGTFVSGAYKAFLSPGTTPNPNVPGSPSQLLAQTTAASTIDCLIPNPISGIPFFSGPVCIFSRANARALIGGALVAGGGLLGLAGLAVLAAAAGMKAAGPAGKAAELTGGALMLVPGAEAAGAGLMAAGKGARSVSRGKAPRRRGDDGQALLGEPRENPGLEVRGGTVRESGADREQRRRRQSAASRSRARRAAGEGRPASQDETGF